MKKLFEEFKAFISRGNVLDMAIGVIIATAFGSITNTLVNNVLMPVIGLIFGGADFTNGLNIIVKPETTNELGEVIPATIIGIGDFVGAIINFLVIALICFTIVKGFNKAHDLATAKERAKKEAEEKKKAEEEAAKPKEPTTEDLLKEIRDLLAKK